MNGVNLSTSAPITPPPVIPFSSSQPLKVLIADDHPLVRRGLIAVLSRRSWIHVLAEVSDGAQAVESARRLHPDIVLMDIDMPHLSGLEATDQLRHSNPAIKVIILSMHKTPDYIARIIHCGARGYLLKDAPPEEVVQAIETVIGDNAYFSSEIARLALNQFVLGGGSDETDALTTREREVLTQIAEGLSNKEIAQRLDVGVRTVETHRERIMRKLDIHSIAGLTKFALARGWVSLPELATT